MAENLRLGSRGEEVRRLQVNLNAAICRRYYGRLVEDGYFGPLTRQAVVRYQTDFRLKSVDGVVGPKTRYALATRVLIIKGEMSRASVAPAPTPPATLILAANPPQPGPSPQPQSRPASPWLIQFQPAAGLTLPPFVTHPTPPPSDPAPKSIVTGQLAMGIVYRTAIEGPHWEFGFGPQFSFNSKNQPTDPRYSLQLQGNVAYADPFDGGRFHTQVFLQVVGLQNFAPPTTVLGAQLGAQVSVDLIADRWNLFAQGALAGAWTLHDASGGTAGQLQFGPQFALGTTVQWGF